MTAKMMPGQDRYSEDARFRNLDPRKSYALYDPDGNELTRGIGGGYAMNARWAHGTEAYLEPPQCIDEDTGEGLPADEIAR